MIAIYTNKKEAQDYADKIHMWLTKNRPMYNAERWCSVEDTVDETGLKYYVKIPPDYEILNAKITLTKEKLILPSSASIVDKLPVDWRKRDIESSKSFITKGLSLFNYSQPVVNSRGEKVSRWQLFKEMLQELWRRIKNLFHG